MAIPRSAIRDPRRLLVLLAVAALRDDAYGVTVQQRVEEETGRTVSLGAVYATLERLQRKGHAGSLLLTRVVAGMLFGVEPTDRATFGAVVLLLVAITALAAWVPTRRAQRIDPILTLRDE